MQNVTGLSDEQSFDAVSGRETIESDAERRAVQAAAREQISPTILAVASVLVAISIALLTTLELLRRRSERLRGLAPS